jgi:hypothetical protein
MAHDGARWLGRAKIIRMAHVKDKNSPINHAKGAPQLIRAPWWGMGWLSADGP